MAFEVILIILLIPFNIIWGSNLPLLAMYNCFIIDMYCVVILVTLVVAKIVF